MSVLQEDMYKISSIDQDLGMNCLVISFSSLPLIPIASLVLALLVWGWSGPVQGPGVDGNLKTSKQKKAGLLSAGSAPRMGSQHNGVTGVRRSISKQNELLWYVTKACFSLLWSSPVSSLNPFQFINVF